MCPPHTGDLASNPGMCPRIEPETLLLHSLVLNHWATPARTGVLNLSPTLFTASQQTPLGFLSKSDFVMKCCKHNHHNHNLEHLWSPLDSPSPSIHPSIQYMELDINHSLVCFYTLTLTLYILLQLAVYFQHYILHVYLCYIFLTEPMFWLKASIAH